MAIANESNRRQLRNYLINPKYQLNYTLILVSVAVLTVLLVIGTMILSAKSNYDALTNMAEATALLKAQLRVQLQSTLSLLVIIGSLFIVAIAVFGVIFSHRTAGPLYKYKKVFDEIIAGNKSARIHCRPNDEFLDVAE